MKEIRIKGLYLHSLNKKVSDEQLKSYGVQKKINAQLKAFNEVFDCKEIVNYQMANDFKGKLISRLPFTAISEKWQYNNNYNDIDFIYFRKNVIDNSILRFFKTIKKHNKNCKIIFEIPTFPYDKEEFFKLKDFPYKLKDRINRNKLHKYIDLITYYGSHQKIIFKTKSLSLKNGIDLSIIPFNKKEYHRDYANIIIVGLFSRWHGYERIIEGLHNYHQNGGQFEFNLHFVGDGVSLALYKDMTDKYKLNNYVFFHGNLSGKDLESLFSICDIGCDSLGNHRRNVHISSSLKTRDYCARGLLIIGSEKIDFIDNDYPFFLKLDSSEDPINFFEIEDFYKKIIDVKNASSIIREYSKENIDIAKVMEPVITYIKTGKYDEK